MTDIQPSGFEEAAESRVEESADADTSDHPVLAEIQTEDIAERDARLIDTDPLPEGPEIDFGDPTGPGAPSRPEVADAEEPDEEMTPPGLADYDD